MTDRGSTTTLLRGAARDLPGNDRPIVVALSGGGVRALAFHLGMFGRLAAGGLLEQVSHVSSVSAGSLSLAIMLSLHGNRWPSSSHYLTELQPAMHHLLTTTDLESSMLRRVMRKPHLLASRGLVFAHVLRSLWGVTATLGELPSEPVWIISATVEEWGQSWSFTSRWMGSLELGYVLQPSLSLAEAVAASSAVPPLLGPFPLSTGGDRRSAPRETSGAMHSAAAKMERIHLWDGGLYDNFGIEGLLRAGTAVGHESSSFLIMSDGSTASRTVRGHLVRQAALRWLDMPGEAAQVKRVRAVIQGLQHKPTSGVYLQIGASTPRIARHVTEDTAACSGYLEASTIRRAAQLPTRLHRLTPQGFDALYRHGWEALDCRLAYHRPCAVGG